MEASKVLLDFEKTGGLIPAVVQDAASGDVLMLAYMNKAAWGKTLETGIATFWSRSRDTLWVKGETSGNVQQVQEIRVDCDQDTVLLKVTQVGGAACHTGHRSCFFRKVQEDGTASVVGTPVFDPQEVYKK
jgi:phosphoribosyl-AMP cyclohydrolase